VYPLPLFLGEASFALPKYQGALPLFVREVLCFQTKVLLLSRWTTGTKFDPNTLEYFEEVPLESHLERNMPVTRRAKHKANSLMAATKASTARMGWPKSAEASTEFVQPIAVVAPRPTGDDAIEAPDDVSNNTAKSPAGIGATNDRFNSSIATADATASANVTDANTDLEAKSPSFGSSPVEASPSAGVTDTKGSRQDIDTNGPVDAKAHSTVFLLHGDEFRACLQWCRIFAT